MENLAFSGIQVLTLAQLTRGEPWQLELLHQRQRHVLLWLTRGQGRVILHGLRRGVGAHNAVFVPAGKLFALESGRHMLGQAILIPADGSVLVPESPQLLRITESGQQGELTALFEAMRREASGNAPFLEEALRAHAQLISIGLRRQILNNAEPARRTASERIVNRYCDILAREFRNGSNMADFAAALDITPTHLARVCRNSCGMTAADMLSQVVQHAARQMLVRTQRPIAEVAESLGFGSAAYFTRFCQQHFDKTPSQVRKSANADDEDI